MTTAFEIELREQCGDRLADGGKVRKARCKRILAFLDREPVGKLGKKVHANRLKRMEDNAELAMLREGYSVDEFRNDRGAIDWSQVPWDKVFDFIIELVTKLIEAFT